MSGVIRNRANQFLFTQTCGGSDFFMIFKDFHENRIWIPKKCILRNVMVWLEVRGKKFLMTIEFKICFRRHLWVRGYPQNQTGWPCDAWNGFYDHKRAEVAIFRFSTSQKAIFKDFQPKIEDLRDFWKTKFWKNGEKNTFYASNNHQISFCRVA